LWPITAQHFHPQATCRTKPPAMPFFFIMVVAACSQRFWILAFKNYKKMAGKIYFAQFNVNLRHEFMERRECNAIT
jgi:hypothetical protein